MRVGHFRQVPSVYLHAASYHRVPLRNPCITTVRGECFPFILRYAARSAALRTNGKCIEPHCRLMQSFVNAQMHRA